MYQGFEEKTIILEESDPGSNSETSTQPDNSDNETKYQEVDEIIQELQKCLNGLKIAKKSRDSNRKGLHIAIVSDQMATGSNERPYFGNGAPTLHDGVLDYKKRTAIRSIYSMLKEDLSFKFQPELSDDEISNLIYDYVDGRTIEESPRVAHSIVRKYFELLEEREILPWIGNNKDNVYVSHFSILDFLVCHRMEKDIDDSIRIHEFVQEFTNFVKPDIIIYIKRDTYHGHPTTKFHPIRILERALDYVEDKTFWSSQQSMTPYDKHAEKKKLQFAECWTTPTKVVTVPVDDNTEVHLLARSILTSLLVSLKFVQDKKPGRE